MTLLTPLGALDGISATTAVHATGRQAAVRAGDGLLGRILDAHGEPIDGKGPIGDSVDAPIYAASPNPLDRRLIDRPLSTGVRAIDATMTTGEGQRRSEEHTTELKSTMSSPYAGYCLQ